MSKSDDKYVGVLLEQIRDEMKAVHELADAINQKVDNQLTNP